MQNPLSDHPSDQDPQRKARSQFIKMGLIFMLCGLLLHEWNHDGYAIAAALLGALLAASALFFNAPAFASMQKIMRLLFGWW